MWPHPSNLDDNHYRACQGLSFILANKFTNFGGDDRLNIGIWQS
jgi:hypothetical protein